MTIGRLESFSDRALAMAITTPATAMFTTRRQPFQLMLSVAGPSASSPASSPVATSASWPTAWARR
jgi:hypothetical protein